MKKNSAIEETVLALKKEIQEHNFNYYVKDDPTVTDSAYDDLMRKLEGLEKQYPELITEDSPTQRVGMLSNTAFKPSEPYQAYAFTQQCVPRGRISSF